MTEPLTDLGNAVLIDREGMRTTAYKDSVGVWTICVGHTSAAGPPEVVPGMTMTEEECCELFAHDVLAYAETVDEVITRPMADHQRDAFTSICYNIGQNGFAESSFAARFNDGRSPEDVAEAILWWDQPDEIIPRREAEAEQFLTSYDVSMPKARSTDAKPIPPPEGWEEPEAEEVLVPPLESWEVGALQARLNYLGFDPGPTDGIWGPRTAQALIDFQRHAGIEVDYGRTTAAALEDDDNRRKP